MSRWLSSRLICWWCWVVWKCVMIVSNFCCRLYVFMIVCLIWKVCSGNCW